MPVLKLVEEENERLQKEVAQWQAYHDKQKANKRHVSALLSQCCRERDQYKALLMATVDAEDGAETWTQEEWQDWLSDLTHAYSQQCALDRTDREMVEAKEQTERLQAEVERWKSYAKSADMMASEIAGDEWKRAERYKAARAKAKVTLDVYCDAVEGHEPAAEEWAELCNAIEADPEGVKAAQEWAAMGKVVEAARSAWYFSCGEDDEYLPAIWNALAELDALRGERPPSLVERKKP